MGVGDQEQRASLLLLGEDEARYGDYRMELLEGNRVAAALSVGADKDSPALVNKGLAAVPNEDALFVLEEGPRVLLAVADGHFGVAASHLALRRLAEVATSVPLSPMELVSMLRSLAVEGEVQGGDSATTLLAVVLRREMEAGFGFSFGDSSCALLGGRHDGRRLNRPNPAYVRLDQPWTLAPDHASFFEFDVRPGGLVLAFSDGIDGCHYRHPDTSVRPRDLRRLFEETGAVAEPFARGLMELALGGVDGKPGGQDNIALVAAVT